MEVTEEDILESFPRPGGGHKHQTARGSSKGRERRSRVRRWRGLKGGGEVWGTGGGAAVLGARGGAREGRSHLLLLQCRSCTKQNSLAAQKCRSQITRKNCNWSGLYSISDLKYSIRPRIRRFFRRCSSTFHYSTERMQKGHHAPTQHDNGKVAHLVVHYTGG